MEKTFAKGLVLLETLVAMQEPSSVTRLANMLGLYKSNVHRLLRTLVENGLVVQVADGRYMPSLRLTELGDAVWSSFDLSPLITPTLAALSIECGHPALVVAGERGGLRVLAAAGVEVSGSLPMQGSARVLADLLRRDPGEGRAVVVPMDGADAQTWHLCLVPIGELRLPAPLGFALIAADESSARALCVIACEMADRLGAVLAGNDAFIAGRTPVSA